MPESSWRAASLSRDSVEKMLTPDSRYSYCHFHWYAVTLMVSSVLEASSSLISVRAAGTAMTTRITTGTMVQMISALVLWTILVSGTAPCDFRNFTSDRIIQPKTKMPIATHHHRMVMCSE